jgi:hypothetical protein
MNHEPLLETIKAGLEEADIATLKSVLETLSEAKQKYSTQPRPSGVDGLRSQLANTPTTPGRPLEFIGKNPPFDPNQNRTFEERAALKHRLKAQNHDWLSQKFKDLQAAWLMVVDGEIIASGGTLADYPEPEQILEVCHHTGKFPFLFINEDVLAIEESGSAWHSTINPDDAYPAVPLTFRSGDAAVAVLADFDTGANSIFEKRETKLLTLTL